MSCTRHVSNVPQNRTISFPGMFHFDHITLSIKLFTLLNWLPANRYKDQVSTKLSNGEAKHERQRTFASQESPKVRSVAARLTETSCHGVDIGQDLPASWRWQVLLAPGFRGFMELV